jgi:hypothetical protein
MMVPAALADLLAHAIKWLIWFRKDVYSFLKECGVPVAVLVEVKKMQAEEEATIKIVKHVLDRLEDYADEGAKVARTMLTKIYYWPSVETIPNDKYRRKDNAVRTLKNLQTAYSKWRSQEDYLAQQREQERKMQFKREDRVRMSDLDHAKLQGFRDEFDRIHGIANAKNRGDEFEKLMNSIFDHYATDSRGPFRRDGEQVDGQFYYDSHWYLAEVRWRKDKSSAADVSVLRDRARDAFGGDGRALFISFNGFSDECLSSLEGKGDERVILMDGYDLRCVLDCRIALDVLLHEKQAYIVREKKPFVGAAEIIIRPK